MPIPDFQTLMLPLLRHLGDGKEHPNQDTYDALAKEFKLSEAELAQLLPSGTAGLFRNRVAWAKAHFKKAGLIESPRRSVYKITPAGLDVLAKNPERIDLRFLGQFPGYREFRTTAKAATGIAESPDSGPSQRSARAATEELTESSRKTSSGWTPSTSRPSGGRER